MQAYLAETQCCQRSRRHAASHGVYLGGDLEARGAAGRQLLAGCRRRGRLAGPRLIVRLCFFFAYLLVVSWLVRPSLAETHMQQHASDRRPALPAVHVFVVVVVGVGVGV